METAVPPLAFIIDTAPLDDADVTRTYRKVAEAVRELIEDGVQICEPVGMVIMEKREQVLASYRG